MDHLHFSDEMLVRVFVQEGNPQLFSELVHRYRAKVIQQCYRKMRDMDAAQDLSQEVWIQVFTKIAQFRGECPFSAWLSIIVGNHCQNHLKKDKHLLNQEISKRIENTLREDEEIDTENTSIPTSDILMKMMDKLNGQDKVSLPYTFYKRG